MNKPDWKDAPAWAKFAAMDSDGYWYWYESEPKTSSHGFWRVPFGRFSGAIIREDWRDTLTERPENE